MQQVIRVRITNISGRTVEGIKVIAEQFKNFGEVSIPGTPLRISHDLGNLKAAGFPINPGDKEFVDCVETKPGSGELYLCHALGGGPLIVTRDKELVLKVLVTAFGTPRQETELQISVDESGVVHCKATS